jgi:diguanylate cyclase (GGDEF)-like protein/putative nucleotidyltransferase with HDIG domain
VRHAFSSFRRSAFTISALAVCLLAVVGTASDELGDAGISPLGHRLSSLSRAEQAANAFVVLLGCVITVSAAAGADRKRSGRAAAEVRALEAQARTDHLTGLGNHRAFEEALSGAIAARAASGSPFVLIAVDVDGLKEVNDTRGHPAGDARIREVAKCLRTVVGRSGTVHRTGGDEFMVLLPGCRSWHGLELARKIDQAAHAATGGRAVSIGLTESLGTEGRHLLVGQADLALYEAKRTKLNPVVFNPGLAGGDRSARSTSRPTRDQRALAAALARAVDAKDMGTQSHSETVAQLSVAIAEGLGITGEHLEQIRIAGLLHDVGKIGVADAILQKRGALDTVERSAMDDHVVVGHAIITAAELPTEAEWVLHHHERYDGKGYPAGWRAAEIPLEARIISVADAYEAMTGDRPYRSRLTNGEALDELRRNAGTQFDGRCVNALIDVVSQIEPDGQPSRSEHAPAAWPRSATLRRRHAAAESCEPAW